MVIFHCYVNVYQSVNKPVLQNLPLPSPYIPALLACRLGWFTSTVDARGRCIHIQKQQLATLNGLELFGTGFGPLESAEAMNNGLVEAEYEGNKYVVEI